jgi:hypothetical protein
VDEETNLPLMISYKAPQPRVVTSNAMAPAGGHAMVASGDAGRQPLDAQREEPVMADYTLYFEEWRDADGVRFPFRMRRAMGGTTIEEWTVSKIKFNPKIDAKTFAVDSGS